MGTDKALLEIDGSSLLDRAIELCRSLCDEILISSDSAEHERSGINRVEDEHKNCGPIGGIHSCLKNSANDWNFVLSVDAPFVERDFVEFLKNNTQDFSAVIPVHHNKKEPLIALYHKNGLPHIDKQITAGNFKLHYLLQELHSNFVDAGAWVEHYPKLFQNLNYPRDLDHENR